MATPETNLLDHMKDDTIWKAAGAVVSALFLGLVGLIRLLYNRDQKKIGTLFNWKDEVVDPHIRAIPKEYVLQRACDRKHDEILAAYNRKQDELLAETQHIRGILEKHLGLNGGGGAGL